MSTDVSETPSRPTDFLREIVAADVAAGKNGGRVQTRFPPEPNGYLHIGHAKAICISFGIAQEFGGKCNLRMDDTNPTKEDTEYVEAIKEDIRWLGFEWNGEVRYASDYFEQLYQWGELLIEKGLAYVDTQSADQIAAQRGTATEAGKNSPFRDRPKAESLELFRKMRAGEFPDGAMVLRAKIDMASPHLIMRDPLMYRIRHAEHHRTGDAWCLYPMYDYAHGESDAIEEVTHSLCSLEFETHKPLYNWFIERLGIFPSKQYEFSKLNLTHTITSKRKLLELVLGKFVSGWDDPRMPTLRGLRRRGYTPEAIRSLVATVGVTRYTGMTDMVVLENSLREHLNKIAPRRMAVLRPLKVTLTNFPEGETVELEAINNPEDPSAGPRKVPFSKTLYIERDDFMENPPKQFFRLGPGREVRLRWAYFIKCHDVVKDDAGNVVELLCTYDPATKGGDAPDGRKVKATLHWVSADHAINAEVRLYDHLSSVPDASEIPEGQDWKTALNPKSLEVLEDAKLEPSLADVQAGERFQFERLGYFCVDPDSTLSMMVFNRSVTLKDEWAKLQKKG